MRRRRPESSVVVRPPVVIRPGVGRWRVHEGNNYTWQHRRASLRPWRLIATFVALTAILYGLVFFTAGSNAPKLGIDLQGGTRITLTAQSSDNTTPTRQSMLLARDIMERRVNGSGVAGAQVQIDGNNQLVVTVPGTQDLTQPHPLRAAVAAAGDRRRVARDRRDPAAGRRRPARPARRAAGHRTRPGEPPDPAAADHRRLGRCRPPTPPRLRPVRAPRQPGPARPVRRRRPSRPPIRPPPTATDGDPPPSADTGATDPAATDTAVHRHRRDPRMPRGGRSRRPATRNVPTQPASTVEADWTTWETDIQTAVRAGLTCAQINQYAGLDDPAKPVVGLRSGGRHRLRDGAGADPRRPGRHRDLELRPQRRAGWST